ncbi:MAG TPA: ABC transporter permease [Casimicrobium huifangae]|nr:ABC transporter permease [Casimicrobium huifangae]HQD65824.1 ABC transporter permease [Casimicrobium huifangae]
MSIIVRLVTRFLAARPWQFALAVALCALGMASAVGIVWLQATLEAHARRQAEGIDIVVGAKGSALQNVLAAVYYLDVPNGNIRLDEVAALRANPMVAQAIAVAMGDSVAGARIVGAGNDFLEFYGAQLTEGALPAAPMEAVVGSALAARARLRVGDSFIGAHGMSSGDAAAEHDGNPYRVVGILKASGRVIDQIAVTPIESVWLVHEGHAAGSEREATFALVQTRGPLGVATLPRMINSTTRLQAAVPALESARLLTSFDWVAIIIKAFAVVLIAAAMASLLGALMQALARREPEMAVLRAMGANRWQLAVLVLAEAVALVLLASLVAAVLLAVGAWLLSHGVLPGLAVDPMVGSGYWGIALIAALCLAVIATIPVLWRSVSIDVAAQLSSR